MINANVRLVLNGINTDVPIGVDDLQIVADYGDDNNQPHITGDNLELTAAARQIVLDWIAGGKQGGVGIFEGMPGSLVVYSGNQVNSFPFFVNFVKEYKNLLQDGVVQVAFTPENNIGELFEQMETMTFGYLESIGHIKASDYILLPYVVEKKINTIEIIMTALVTYVLAKALKESIKNTVDSGSIAIGLGASGPIGPIGAAIYKIASAILNIAYTIAIAIALVSLAKTLFNSLLPPKREHKVIKWKRAMELVCSYYGYQFETSISELNNLVYLPSNPNLDTPNVLGWVGKTQGTKKGIPNINDYGYICSEMFDMAKKVFTAKMTIEGNTVQLRAKNDPYWVKSSKYTLPDVQLEVSRYNTDKLNTTVLNTFSTDLNDEWTVDNYLGTALEVRTNPRAVNVQKRFLGKGYKENRYNVALGTRKNDLNALETILKTLARSVDKITGILGKGSNLAGRIEIRKGLLKQSNNWTTLPKLLYVDGSSLPINHRELFNAKTLYEKYGLHDSFVRNGYFNQKTVYEGVKVPFGISDFDNLVENSFFTFEGKRAKIVTFEWSILKDYATVTFWVREPYTFNLVETYIYPE